MGRYTAKTWSNLEERAEKKVEDLLSDLLETLKFPQSSQRNWWRQDGWGENLDEVGKKSSKGGKIICNLYNFLWITRTVVSSTCNLKGHEIVSISSNDIEACFQIWMTVLWFRTYLKIILYLYDFYIDYFIRVKYLFIQKS